MQALLLEAKAQHLLTEANQGTERGKQLEAYVSHFHEKFQNLLLSNQARNTESRHSDLQVIEQITCTLIARSVSLKTTKKFQLVFQRISELEMKLTRSLTTQ